MHSPLTVAHEIRRPFPEVRVRKPGPGTPQGPRWAAHWHIGDKEWYFPPLVTIWHREPDDADSGTVCTRRTAWRWHVEHWEFQVHPVQDWRRRIMTRCAECGGKSTKTDPVNVSRTWDSPKVPWWYPEQGLYHQRCGSVASNRDRERHEAGERLKTWDQYRAQIAVLTQAAADLRGVGEPEAADYLLLDAERIRHQLEQEAAEVVAESKARREARR